MIVEGFDNAWHVLRGWAGEGYEFFVLERGGRVPQPRPLRREEVRTDDELGLNHFRVPQLSASVAGDNPDAARALTPAEILLAAAIAEGWEPDIV